MPILIKYSNCLYKLYFPWIATYYFGLQGTSNGVNAATLYSDCPVTTSLFNSAGCDACKKAGQAVLGLYLTSFFFMLIVITTSFVRMFNDTEAVKLISLVLLFLIWIFTVAGFGNWNSQCWGGNFEKSSSIASATKSYFVGYAAGVTSWVFVTILFFFHVLTPTSSEDSLMPPSAPSTTTEASPTPAVAEISKA